MFDDILDSLIQPGFFDEYIEHSLILTGKSRSPIRTCSMEAVSFDLALRKYGSPQNY